MDDGDIYRFFDAWRVGFADKELAESKRRICKKAYAARLENAAYAAGYKEGFEAEVFLSDLLPSWKAYCKRMGRPLLKSVSHFAT